MISKSDQTGHGKASMNKVKLTRRGKIVVVALILLAAFLFGYATHDVCWVGTSFPGNKLGYGSCEALMDFWIGGNK